MLSYAGHRRPRLHAAVPRLCGFAVMGSAYAKLVSQNRRPGALNGLGVLNGGLATLGGSGG